MTGSTLRNVRPKGPTVVPTQPYGSRLVRTQEHLLGKTAKLPKLTGSQHAFVMNIHRGAGPMEAYRNAFPNQRASCSPQTIATSASMLLANPKILGWLDYLTRNEVAGQIRTVAEHVSNLDRIRIAADDAGDLRVAFQAEQSIGKVSGLYVERTLNETNVTFNASSLELALASRNPAFAERLRQAHAMADSMDGTAKLLEMAPDVVSEPVPVSRNRDRQR